MRTLPTNAAVAPIASARGNGAAASLGGPCIAGEPMWWSAGADAVSDVPLVGDNDAAFPE